MIAVCSALILGALPFFMMGGLAVQAKDDLGFSEAALGLAVTIGFLTGAVSAPFTGRVADRIGAKRAVYLGCALSAASMMGIAVFTFDLAILIVFLCLAGAAIATIDPGLAVLVSRSIPPESQGLAFGVKEASIPAAGLLAGIAVPTIALSVGWRWAFALGVLPLLAVLVLLPRVTVGSPRPRLESDPTASSRRKMIGLLVAAVAAALGTGAASGVGIFITDSAVAMGFTPAAAGLLLALGSVTGVVARIATGVRADRSRGLQFSLIAGMLGVGAATMALGATGVPLLLVLATIGTFAGAWAWTGLYFLSLVHSFPHRPGAIAGIGTAGLGIGNAIGPVLFGLAAGAWSYEAAWMAAAIVAGAAAILMAMVRKML